MNFPGRYVEELPLVGKLAFRPGLGDYLQGFVHHAGGVLQINPKGRHLVRVTGTAHTQIDPAFAHDIQGGHPSGYVQWVLNRWHSNCHS